MNAVLTAVGMLVFSTHLFAAPAGSDRPRRCRWALSAHKVGMDFDQFEANARRDFAEYERVQDLVEQGRMIGLRDQLAEIENRNPRGFNTFTHSRRDGMRVQIKSLLRLGQDRRVRMLVGKLVTDVRHAYRELQKQDEVREEALQSFFDAHFSQRADFAALIRAIDDNRLKLKREIGSQLWLYTGIVGVLLESAELKAPAGLIPDGIDRALLEDQSRAFLRVEAALGALGGLESMAPPALPREEVAKIVALRVLQGLRVVDSDGHTEISPTLAEVEQLYVASATVRTAKIESEIKYEQKHQWAQYLLSIASDQYLVKLLSVSLNALTLGKFKEFFAETQKELEKGINQNIHQGRILEFIGLADRLSDDDTGNEQLATALITLLGTDSNLLGSLAATEEGIEPLKRVKRSAIAKDTIWGPKGKKLAGVIEELEGLRAKEGITSAINLDNRRSHFVLKGTVATLIAYGAVAHSLGMPPFGSLTMESVKAMISGFFH